MEATTPAAGGSPRALGDCLEGEEEERGHDMEHDNMLASGEGEEREDEDGVLHHQHLQHEGEEGAAGGSSPSQLAAGGGGLCSIIRETVEAPVHALLNSSMLPAAVQVEQDIASMLQGMQQSQAQAEGEKAGVDAELLRIQQLIRSFQDRIAQVMGLGL